MNEFHFTKGIMSRVLQGPTSFVHRKRNCHGYIVPYRRAKNIELVGRMHPFVQPSLVGSYGVNEMTHLP